MSLRTETLAAAVEEAIKRAKRRRFVQSVEVIMVFRGIDLQRPENRINMAVPLPNPIPNKVARVAAFAHGAFELAAKEAGVDLIINREQIDALAGNKRQVRKLAKSYDFFITTPDLMPLLGRVIGPIFGPRGKMPEAVPPNADVKSVVERLRRSVRVRMRTEPSIKTRVGSEAMEPLQVAENITAIASEVSRRINLTQHLSALYVKLTMGPPVSVKLAEVLSR